MVDTLRCDEVLSPARHHSTPMTHASREPLILPPAAAIYHDLMPVLSQAIQDRAIFRDERVVKNLLKLEHYYLPKMDHYNILQDELKLHMRQIVTEWMLDVCMDQSCSINVFLLATNIMDRFLQTLRLCKSQFQLVAAASIFLASKMIDPSPISAIALIRCTADTYDKDELLDMELLILSKIQWDLTAVTSYNYVDYLIDALVCPNKNVRCPPMLRSSKADEVRRTTEKLITLCATLSDFTELPPSIVSSAALLAAIRREPNSTLSQTTNINDVIARLQTLAPLNTDLLCENMNKIERAFFRLEINEDSVEEGEATSSASEANSSGYMTMTSQDKECENPMNGAASNLDNEAMEKAWPPGSEDEKEVVCRAKDNKTPTEVFKVSASCVT